MSLSYLAQFRQFTIRSVTLSICTLFFVSIIGLPPAAAQPVGNPGYLGLVVDPLSTGSGLAIVDVAAGGPAEKGGLKKGDRIIMIRTIAINNPGDLAAALSGTVAGSVVPIRFERSGIQGEAKVTLSERPAGLARPPAQGNPPVVVGGGQAVPRLPRDATDDGILLGVHTRKPTLRDLLRIKAPAQFTRGALVTIVFPGTPAANAGIPLDALIYAVDGQTVANPTELIRRVRRAGEGNVVEIRYTKNGQDRTVRLRLASQRQVAKPPAGGANSTMEARLGALERRMTSIEQRLVDLQRTLDLMLRPPAQPLPPRNP